MSKQDTRKKILKAAETLFSKNGYEGVTTKIIAKEAGITEMTLFNHFPQKELLYQTILKEKYMETNIHEIFTDLTYNDLEKDLKIISNKLIKGFIQNKNILMMRLKTKENYFDDSNFRLNQDPILHQIMPIFKLYHEKGILNESSEKSALLFIGSIKGLLYVSLLDKKNEEEIHTLINDFVITICNGFINR